MIASAYIEIALPDANMSERRMRNLARKVCHSLARYDLQGAGRIGDVRVGWDKDLTIVSGFGYSASNPTPTPEPNGVLRWFGLDVEIERIDWDRTVHQIGRNARLHICGAGVPYTGPRKYARAIID